jgi:cell wall assembly regulator SMI1
MAESNGDGITPDELGKMLGVSSKRIDEWNRGQSAIPPAQLAMLHNAAVALDLLEQTFESERLPKVIRRSAALFDGERALDWILRGRIQDVAERYDRVLMYQA